MWIALSYIFVEATDQTRQEFSYQELESLSLRFWRELRWHWNDLIASNNDRPADTHKQCWCTFKLALKQTQRSFIDINWCRGLHRHCSLRGGITSTHTCCRLRCRRTASPAGRGQWAPCILLWCCSLASPSRSGRPGEREFCQSLMRQQEKKKRKKERKKGFIKPPTSSYMLQ